MLLVVHMFQPDCQRESNIFLLVYVNRRKEGVRNWLQQYCCDKEKAFCVALRDNEMLFRSFFVYFIRPSHHFLPLFVCFIAILNYISGF